MTSRRFWRIIRSGPTTPRAQRLQAWHAHGLGSFHFARRYFGNHYCFLFLELLRCFSSLRSPPYPMDSGTDIPTLPGMGFPIQKSPDQSLLGGSPKLIAAFHVFHRLLAPRHPPFALNSLATIKPAFGKNACFCPYRIVKERSKSDFAFCPETRSGKPFQTTKAFRLGCQDVLVEVNGLEPMTSCLQSRRSPT